MVGRKHREVMSMYVVRWIAKRSARAAVPASRKGRMFVNAFGISILMHMAIHEKDRLIPIGIHRLLSYSTILIVFIVIMKFDFYHSMSLFCARKISQC